MLIKMPAHPWPRLSWTQSKCLPCFFPSLSNKSMLWANLHQLPLLHVLPGKYLQSTCFFMWPRLTKMRPQCSRSKNKLFRRQRTFAETNKTVCMALLSKKWSLPHKFRPGWRLDSNGVPTTNPFWPFNITCWQQGGNLPILGELGDVFVGTMAKWVKKIPATPQKKHKLVKGKMKTQNLLFLGVIFLTL